MRASSTTRCASASAIAARRTGRELDERGQRLPLRLPAANRALVLLRHRRQHRRDQSGRLHRGRDAPAPPPRDCACAASTTSRRARLRRVRRPRRLRSAPAARGRGRSCRAIRTPCPARRRRRDQAAALGVPRHVGHAQAEPGGQRVGYGWSRRAQARERARRAAKLHDAASSSAAGQPRTRAARRPRAIPRPSGQTSWASPAAATCGRPSAWSRSDRARPAAPRPRHGRATPECRRRRRAVAAPAPCPSHPGSWRPSARAPPPSASQQPPARRQLPDQRDERGCRRARPPRRAPPGRTARPARRRGSARTLPSESRRLRPTPPRAPPRRRASPARGAAGVNGRGVGGSCERVARSCERPR